MADQSSKCPINITLGQLFVLAKVKCYFYHCTYISTVKAFYSDTQWDLRIVSNQEVVGLWSASSVLEYGDCTSLGGWIGENVGLQWFHCTHICGGDTDGGVVSKVGVSA